jgi:aldehyde:ferredoxin oxidoreductase
MANNGWTGKILRINLSTATVQEEATSKYEPEKYIGGRGFGAKIAWDEIPPNVGPFDPENRLMFFTGPLVGTMAPCSGRWTVCGVGAQNGAMYNGVGGYTWSGIGGRFGIEMKFAGYDGIIFQGKSPAPVYLWVQDGHAEIRAATDLWGMTTGSVTRALMKRHGDNTKVASIGPAGENKSRIGSIITDSGSAAGQGGFGGVMGSKNLKAVAIQGSGKISVYDSESLLTTTKKVNHEWCTPIAPVDPSFIELGHTKQNYSTTQRGIACTMGCQAFCEWAKLVTNSPGQALETDITTVNFCFGISSLGPGYESTFICNQLGINGWDFGSGIVPLLEFASQQGLVGQVDGIPIPAPTYTIINGKKLALSNKLNATLLRKLAYREDALGDAMAEGGVLMANKLWPAYPGSALSVLEPVLTRAYPGYPSRPIGCTGHWDCHWAHNAVQWPHWIVAALIWATANRDPGDDTLHSFTDNIARYPGTKMCDGSTFTQDKVDAVSKRLYGMTGAMDPAVSFDPPEAKAKAAQVHKWKGALLSSLLLCDWQMPRIFSVRKMTGPQTYPQAESEMYSAVTGLKTSEQEMDKAGERIVNLERAIDVRYGRTRAWDEAAIPYFSQPSMDKVVGNQLAFDGEKFKKQLTALYTLSGWDTVKGWPTRPKLEDLGLKYVADGLATINKLPA